MSRPSVHRLRKFRFERPQQIAALLLLLFFGQCLWISAHRTLSETDYQYARCGRETWEKPALLTGYFTTCGNIPDGILAWRAAGLPLTIDRILSGESASTSTWEMRHEIWSIRLLVRLPFMLAGLALGACLWWVTRRLFGNTGGYIALALYCFSPPILRASTVPNSEILAAFGIFSAVYTAIGVSHALQGPRRKWRPRIILLAVILGFTAAAHISAFALALLFCIAFMAWVAEGKRALIPTLLIFWIVSAFLLLFAAYSFRLDAFSYIFRSAAGMLWISLEPARWFFTRLTSVIFTIAIAGSLALYAAQRRSRYFGNTAPLIVAVVLFLVITTGVHSEPWLWALPFFITFIAGIFADVLETRHRRLFLFVTGGILLAQAALCLATLPLLTQ
ncbi:ArnT family glycosyltransferase [Paracidobacterium acidisoli]|uniref:Glycosyltransferase RgtA/B/C/D-like domain-containing protein n=1 Tax=Paracidobacterium acidisoli TaxID=2303751 RepID=A0A372IMB1_9BACT|nr:hypothetical protein [Paracidobacterium acidisoli]MBT9331703.1 hypothetical protein [Paracidobacterium acidisoli]